MWSRQKLIVRFHIFVYRLTRGRVLGRIANGRVLLLTTTRPKTKKRVTVALLFLEDGGEQIVIASNGGRDWHPAWYRHLLAEPECTVQVLGERSRRRAETIPENEKGRLWPEVLKLYAGYAEYRKRTERLIPLVRLRGVG